MKIILFLSCSAFLAFTGFPVSVFTSGGETTRTMGVAQKVPGGTSFTVEGWVRVAEACPSSRENVLWAQYVGSAKGRIDLYVKNGKLGLFCGGGLDADGNATVSETIASTVSVPNGVWTHVAYVRDETARTYALYVNGEPAGNGSSPCTVPNASFSTIGGLMSTLGAKDAYLFYGSLADVRVWTVARTAEEISRDRFRRLSGFEPGLFTYLPLDRKDSNTTPNVTENEICTVVDQWQLTEDSTLVLDPCPSPLEKGVAFSPGLKGDDASVTTDLRLTGTAFTIEGWFNLEVPTAKKGIAYQYPGAGRLSFEVDKNARRYTCWFNGKSLYSPDVPTNTWVHIALVRDGAKGAFYTNGVEAASTAEFSASQTMAAQDLALFALSAAKTSTFSGSMREFRVWSVARSAAEISADMGRSLGAPTDGLLACWPLREGIGDQIVNCVGNKTNTVVSASSAAPWKVGSVPVLSGPTVERETCALFTGSHFSSGSTGMSLTETNFTFEAWVCPRPYGLQSDHTVNYQILNQFLKGADGRIIFEIVNGRVSLYIGGKTPGADVAGLMSGNTEVPPNVWTHLAVTRDAGTVRIYVNGVCDGEWTNVTLFPPSPGEMLLLGGVESRETFDGWLRELRVWNRACTEEEIHSRFQFRLRGTEGGLLATYALDEAGTILVNGRRGGADGTLECAWVSGPKLDLKKLPPLGLSIIVR